MDINKEYEESLNCEEFLKMDFNNRRLYIRREIENSDSLKDLCDSVDIVGYDSIEDIKYFLEMSIMTSYIMAFDDNIEIDVSGYIKKVCDIFKMLSLKNIPEKYDGDILRSNMIRDKIISLQGYSLVTKEWVKHLADWIGDRKCLEIMAGRGTLSYALREEDVYVISTDNFTWNTFDFSETWTDIEKIDAIGAIEKYGNKVDIIIMSWCYMNDLGYRCLKKMREVNPDAIMIYIGEGEGGCTGSTELYREMCIIDDSSIDYINQIYPRWFGIHDRLYLIK